MPRRVQVISQRRCLGVKRGYGVLIWVVCYEAEYDVAACVDLDDVATNGSCWGVDGGPAVDASVGCGALYYLKVVAVYMEWMAACVEVVDYDFDGVHVV